MVSSPGSHATLVNDSKATPSPHLADRAADDAVTPFPVLEASREAGSAVLEFPVALSERLFDIAAASALHRLSIFSAAVAMTASLHGTRRGGRMLWRMPAAVLGVPAEQVNGSIALPWRWATPVDRDLQVKTLFGAELAQWRTCRDLLGAVGATPEEDENLSDVQLRYRECPEQSSPAGEVLAAVTVDACLTRQGGRIEVRCQAAAGGAPAAVRLADRLLAVVKSMITAPAARLEAITMLGDAERELVVDRFNATDAAYPADALLHELIEAQVRRTPQAPALSYAGQVLDYATLNARANRLARYLRDSAGVVPDSCVAVCLQRSVEMVVALLAVLKSGAAYVPLDPSLPTQRLARMLDDAAPRALLTHAAVEATAHAAMQSHAAETGVAVLDLEADAGRWAGMTADDLPAAAIGQQAADLAYVIYTSGSTGQPKGVMNTHRGIVNRLHWMQKAYPLSAADVVLQKTPFGFDVSVWEFFWPLLAGARLELARPEGHKDPAYLAELIVQARVSTLHFVPSMLSIFMEQAPAQALAGVRQVFCSGEALPARSVERFLEQYPGVALHNLYGPTEAAVDVSAWDCRNGPLDGRVPIGRPIDNLRLYVLDAQQQPVPLGCEGELYIAGAGVARGYLNRPELTAERFGPDPFHGDGGQRMYRTGDLVRQLADGNIEYLGRNDFQVKLRGFRIELGEIEAVLATHPGVREVAVVARPDPAGEPSLVAYLVGPQVEVEALRLHLAGQLASYMLPAAYVVLEAMPLSANGKLDRSALPEPLRLATGAGHVPPQGPLETQLAALWCQVLGLDRVGREDHFFELGGHSLRAARMLARVERETGQSISLLEFFANDTIAGLARHIVQSAPVPRDAPLALPRGQPLPASMAQRRMWFLEQLDPGANRAYHLPIAVRLDGALDRAALRAAIDALQARHEALRTRFCVIDDLPHQIIDPASPGIALIDYDVSGLPPHTRRHRLEEAVEEEAGTPFNLETGPLVRGRLIHLDENEHALLLTLHHIIADGASLQVLADDLASGYRAALAGVSAHAAAPELQQADLSAWQDARLLADTHAEGLAYWTEHLRDAPPLLALPCDRPRPARQSHRGAQVVAVLPTAQAQQLRRLAQDHGATLFMVMLTAWSTLLSRLTGQQDVMVGTAVANRDGAAMADAVGLFVNTVALRLRPGECESVHAALGNARSVVLGAFEHQHVPFESVVEALRPQRSLSYSPLFQSMLTVDGPSDGPALQLADVQVTALAEETRTTHFDASLAVMDDGTQIVCALEYAQDLFDRCTVEAWLDMLQTLLLGMVEQPGQAPARLSLLPAAQEQALLQGHAGASVTLAAPALVHARFRAQALRTPDAVAIEEAGSSLTYAELDQRTDRLATWLRGTGLQREELVALCLDRSIGMVTAMLGVLKAGGAYVPLDPSHPDERLRFVLDDCRPRILLADAGLIPRLRGLAGVQVQVHELPAMDSDAAQESGAEAAADLPPYDSLAYVIYTSGSTGAPKGVMVEHASVVNHMQVHARLCGMAEGDRVLQFASCTFDTSVEEIFPALAVGATVVLRPADMMVPDESFARFLQAQRINVLDLPTAFWHLWSQEVAAGRSLPPDTLRIVVIGGEAALASRLDDWQRAPQTAGCPVLNTYGPTEATIYATAQVLSPADATGAVTIGVPIDNVQVFVLDAEGQPLPPGLVGEIHLAGAGLARGYLGRTQLTAERFVPAAFSPHGSPRLYRTGDLGRWRRNGELEYIGRNDFQIKLRGYRIELGEIEASLAACPGIRESVVLPRRDAQGDLQLQACIVAEEGADTSPPTLRGWLAARLPGHMIPASFVTLPALPLTGSGKLDRNVLSALADVQATRDDGDSVVFQPPRGATEQALAELWQELLQVPKIGRGDSFFERGGHSLMALALLSRIRSRLHRDVSLKDLFANPVLSQLADALQRAPVPSPPITVAQQRWPSPLSFAQQRLWFLAQLPGGSTAYHIPLAVELRGPLQFDALASALRRVTHRHQVLRSRIAPEGGAPLQVLLPPSWEMPVVLEELNGDPQALQRLLQRMADEPFDLERDPPLRVCVARMQPDQHILAITLHHIAADGWSVARLFDEVGTLYRAFSAGQADPLAEPLLQYADYAQWQRRWLAGDVLQTHSRYWAQSLANAPTILDLPADRPRAPEQCYDGATVAIQIDAGLAGQLRQLARHRGMTLYMVVLAGWGALLSRLGGQTDLIIGTPVANRALPESEAMVGLFTNTLALRLRIEGSVSQVLAQAKDVVEGAQVHQQMPFEQVLEIAKPPRQAGRTPLFQVLLNWLEAPLQAPDLSPLQVAALQQDYTVAKFDLELAIGELEDGGLGGELRYATALYDPATIEQHRDYLLRMLRAMATDTLQAVEDVELLSEEQRAVLAPQAISAGRDATDATQQLHVRFQQQAAERPGAVALRCGDQQLSYARLNGQANQLARYLRKCGVGSEDRVAICMERGIDMIVALLAVLKAGAAYVPIDPGYPAERIAYMLADADPALLLTDGVLDDVVNALPAGQTVVDVRRQKAMWAQQPDSDLPPTQCSAGGRDLAYIIYTSGSTGLPKGTMVEHAHALRLFTATRPWFDFTQEDVWTLFHSIAFDFSVWEIFGALLHGGRLVVVPQATTRSPREFLSLLARENVTVLNQTPSAFYQLAHAEASDAPQLTLRWIIFGGEALDLRKLASWYARHPDTQPRLVNMYGITETTVHVTYRPLFAGDVERFGAVSPIGEPIPDLRLYLLDSRQRPVPTGVVGELYVAGAGVARGYFRREALTGERFIIDPHGSGQRLYRTGDLGRRRSDGEIEYLGRNDLQVKIRGFRIELGEIESALLVCPGVREAIVLCRPDAHGEPRLVAWILPAVAGAAPSAATLRDALSLSLAEYMVPSAFVAVDRWPLTGNGKLDRQALPAPDRDSLAVQSYAPPTNEKEQAVAAILAELLGLERVGRHDDFFALGGHSLLALQVVERLRAAGLHTDVQRLFRQPTPAGIAASADSGHAVATGKTEAPAGVPDGADRITPDMLPLVALSQAQIDGIVAAVPGGAGNVQDIYPLAPLQEGFLFHHLFQQRGDVYLTTTVYHARTKADALAYIAAVQQVIDRHDILRTSLAWEGLDQPVQVVWRKAPLCGEHINLDPDGGDVTAQLIEHFDPSHYRMDLRQAPLWRIVLAHDETHDRWVMLELIHHIIDDRTTMQLLEEEVRSILNGATDALPPPRAFRDFVARATEATRIRAPLHEAFFRGTLGDVDVPTAPFNILEVPAAGDRIREYGGALPDGLVSGLRRAGRQARVGVAALCHLAWAVVLSRLCDRDDVVFGTVLSGRTGEGGDDGRALGVFINTLPLRITLERMSVAECLQQTHQNLLDLMQHEQAPLVLAQRCSAVAPPLPLFTSLVNYRHVAGTESASAGPHGEDAFGLRFVSGHERSNYPFNLSFNDHAGAGLSIDLQCPSEVNVDALAAMLETTLNALVLALDTMPSCAVGDLEVLPPARRAALLQTSTTPAACDGFVPLHHRFEATAARLPDAVAVRDATRSLRYRELDAAADRLAAHLHHLGVARGARVGLCVDRGVPMTIALLAVLKAGGAFVPLDPTLPPERLRYMLQDAQPVAVLACPRQLTAVTLEVLRASQVPLVDLQEPVDPQMAAASPGGDPVSADDLAYVLYTSGSTGKPKGVMVHHGALAHYLQHVLQAYMPAPVTGGVVATPFGFDATLTTLLGPWLSGGTVILTPDDREQSLHALASLCQQPEPLLFKLTPSHLEALADILRGAPGTAAHVFVVGGEALQWRTVERFRRLVAPAATIINEYGPTETVVGCSTHVLTPDMPADGTAVSIGRPIGGTRIYLLDRHGRLVPEGVAGEVHIGGDGVALGYLGRSELTAERFVVDPFRADRQHRMYRSGDLAAWSIDGTLVYLGRNDEQVKLRGHRVELGEVEACVAECAGVRDVAVSVHRGSDGHARLVAHVVTESGRAPDATQLRRQLAGRLADYMIPQQYVAIPALPLTPNGKLDRAALRAPDAPHSASQFVAPGNVIEQRLATLWESVLGHAPVGREDDFFALGGQSLLAVRLMVRVRDTLGVDLPIRQLFVTPVLKDLAAWLQASRSTDPSHLVTLRAEGERAPLFLIHPGEGEVAYAHALSRCLDPQLPLYALAAQGMVEGEEAADDLQQIAKHYIATIRSVQPSGPYRIAGWSLGGTIAYEMARQLLEAGQRVGFVGLLDTRTTYPDALRLRGSKAESMPAIEYLLYTLGSAAAPSVRSILEWHAGRYDLHAMVAVCQRHDLLDSDLDTATVCRHIAVRAGLQAAVAGYRPQALRAGAWLFAAADSDIDLHADWHAAVGDRVRCITVPGDHYSIVTPPNIEALAEAIEQALEDVHEGQAEDVSDIQQEQEA